MDLELMRTRGRLELIGVKEERVGRRGIRYRRRVSFVQFVIPPKDLESI